MEDLQTAIAPEETATASPAPPAPAPSPAPPARQPYRFRRIPSFTRLAFVSLTSLALGAGALVGGLGYIRTVVPIASERNIDPNPIALPFEKAGKIAFPQAQDRMNILVLGVDNNYDRKGIMYTKGARSDTMMVVSLSSEAKYLNVVSIPRDCYVLISNSLGYEKINAAYSFGGPQQAMETVEQFLGVPIHHYLVVKIKGAQKTMDVLGGLPINVEKDMDYDDNWGHLHVHLKKGPQVLSGEQAVGYARFRHDEESDRGRIRRQQQVIRALVERLKNPQTVMAIPQLAQAVKGTLETDLQIPEMADLARLYSGFDQKKMKGGQIEGNDTTIGDQSMIIPYAPTNDRLVRALLKDPDTMALKDLRVCVLNGSNEPGAGQRLADRLSNDGLQVVKIDLADKTTYPKTQVLEHSKNNRMHTRLTSFLTKAEFKEVPSPQGQDYDVTIIVGNDKPLSNLRTAPPPDPRARPEHVRLQPGEDPQRNETGPGVEIDDPALRAIPRSTPSPSETPAAATEPTPR